ncbi:uncharacterized protein LOC119374675 isoform X2 [Rhipicephalus sanguineus]|uniref:uncharacterized protein LOC119374675 isoform X2 n=2 Tax=Rhipicephalus sanguineus TaxID=34632 RepID=UPI0018931AE7|nr:uncharacterized protein LOC119374675 isoform X2 [Rhipicephalus sanguineus]
MARNACFLVLLFGSSLGVLHFNFRGPLWKYFGLKKRTPTPGSHRYNISEYKEYSMARLLCTKEPIWLYNTTGSIDRECEVDGMEMISRLEVFLLRSYYENGAKVSAHIEGRFDPSDKKRMFLKIPTAARAIVQSLTEELVYLSKKLRCAVIKITVAPGLQGTGLEYVYDLRVRTRPLARGPSRGCIGKFAKLATSSSRIYQPRCQDILRKQNEQKLIIEGKGKPKNDHL